MPAITPSNPIPGIASGRSPTPPQGQVPKYTLHELEQNLQESIKAFLLYTLNDDQEDEEMALMQAEDEIVDVKKATISQLDSTLKEPKFSEFGVGLKEHQEYTKSLLDKITKEKEKNATKAGYRKNEINTQITLLIAIQTQLAEVHKARISLLDEHQKKETNIKDKHAYGLLKTHWDLAPVINSTDPTIDGLFQQSEVITKTNDRNSWIHKLQNGCIEGTDPIAVGYAMAATNYKGIEFSGTPQQALKAAIAAFDAGAEDVSLSRETLASLENPSSFKSTAEWKQTTAEYKAFMERQAARAEIKNSKNTNHVFDPKTPEDKASDNLKVFNKLPPDSDPKKASLAQMQMLIGMGPKDVAELAWKAREQNYTDQHVKGIKYFNQLYRQVLQKKYPAPSFSIPFASKPYQEFRKVAYEAYKKQLFDYAKDELVELKNKSNNINDIANHIAKQADPDVQKELFKELANANLYQGPELTEARAACLAKLMDQYNTTLANTDQNDKEKVLAKFENRIGSLLGSLNAAEKKAIQDITVILPEEGEDQTPLNKKYREIYKESENKDLINLREIFDNKLKLDLKEARAASSISLRAEELFELMVTCDTDLTADPDNGEAIFTEFTDKIQEFKHDYSNSYFRESLNEFIQQHAHNKENHLDEGIKEEVENLAHLMPPPHSDFSMNY
jgi:hypothetical protein